MDNLFSQMSGELAQKGNWTPAEIRTKLFLLRDKLKQDLINRDKIVNETILKYTQVEKLKKYDVIHMPTYGTFHYILVYKVDEKISKVMGLAITTKEYHSIHEIKDDRVLTSIDKKSYVSKGFVEYDLEEAKKYFVKVFESKVEANECFKRVKEYYSNLLGLRIK